MMQEARRKAKEKKKRRHQIMSEIFEQFSRTLLVAKLFLSFILGLALFITFFPNKTEIIKTSYELIAPLSIGVIGALMYDSGENLGLFLRKIKESRREKRDAE